MTYITNLNIFFRILLDNLTKVIYNGISDFISSCFAGRTGVASLAFFLLFSFSGTLGVGAEEPILDICLECLEEDGGLDLLISFPDGVAFCGAYLELIYGGSVCFENLTFSGGSPMGGMLSFVDRDGRVAILLDGDGQVFDGGGVKVGFSFLDAPSGEVRFEIVSGEAYFWQDDALVRLEVGMPSVCFVPDVGEPTEEREPPKLLEIKAVDGDIRLGGNAPDGCFAAGFEVFSVSLSTAEVCRFTVISVTSAGECESNFETRLEGLDGRYCIILRPVAYFRDGARYGEEKTILIIDGKIRGEDLGFP